MTDFVFGGIEADEQRLLATERDARSGIRHFHAITPLDPTPGQPVRLTVQVGPDVAVDRVTAYVTTDGALPVGSQGVAQQGFAVHLTPVATRWEPLIWDYVTLWEGELPGQPAGTLVQYVIEGWRSFAPPLSVWSREQRIDRTSEARTLYGYHVDDFATPTWAHRAIVYHVFVDRFTGVENRWLEPGEMEHFAGGTLRGVIDRLDYIAALGVTALWISPVFVTESYHGYDTTDYFNVDPRFGSNADLLELFEQAHARNLRVILDFVANHTSVQFAPFVKALNDPSSEYRRWFSFDPVYEHGYRTFFGVAAMPQLDADLPAVRDYLCRAAQHWLAAGADGLRLDYAAGPSHVFWSSFRAACRQVKPDCWLFGEVTRAGDMLRTYSGRLDGCLDFSFCRAVRMLCAQPQPAMTLSQFANQVQASQRFFDADFTQPAFIDNHDMNRFLWAAGNDRRRLRLALALLFGLGGSPCLYYGTEVGLGQPRAKGPWREEARHPMLWGEAQDRELLRYTTQLIDFRRRHPALSDGVITTHYLDDAAGVWLVERRSQAESVWLAVNLSATPQQLALPPGSYATAAGAIAPAHIVLEPVSAVLLVATES
ncbi:MAG TPA: DUF3459 domain-containing protein [Chloroflexi bacterium]|nr:DUF3459 domain-containing protein [Chloroflexota bacterium]